MLRMGIEVSDVIVEAEDVFGHGVNLAARLMSLAGPGEIVVSQRVRDGLTPSLDADVEDLGDCYVKGIPQPVRAYRVGPPGPQPMVRPRWPSTSWRRRSPSSRSPRATSPTTRAWSAKSSPRRSSGACRTPRTSSSSRASRRPPSAAATPRSRRSARTSAPTTSSRAPTARRNSHFKLDVELAETKSGRILWIESLDDDLAAIVSGEQELIGRLIAGVGAAVTTRELQRSRSQPLPTLKAYTLLMGAISLMHRLSPPDFAEAHRLLQALIDRGVRHPLPIAWLGNWHVLRVQQGWSDDPPRDTYLALECTKRALDMDPDHSLALAIDGFVHVNLLKKFDVAEESYERALAANPSNAFAWLLKGTLHAFKSEGEPAVEYTERALALSPLDPHRYFYDSLAATAAVSAGRYGARLELAQRSLRANRKHTSTWRAHDRRAVAARPLRRGAQSAQELLKLQPTMTVSGWLKGSPAAGYEIGRLRRTCCVKRGYLNDG